MLNNWGGNCCLLGYPGFPPDVFTYPSAKLQQGAQCLGLKGTSQLGRVTPLLQPQQQHESGPNKVGGMRWDAETTYHLHSLLFFFPLIHLCSYLFTYLWFCVSDQFHSYSMLRHGVLWAETLQVPYYDVVIWSEALSTVKHIFLFIFHIWEWKLITNKSENLSLACGCFEIWDFFCFSSGNTRL